MVVGAMTLGRGFEYDLAVSGAVEVSVFDDGGRVYMKIKRLGKVVGDLSFEPGEADHLATFLQCSAHDAEHNGDEPNGPEDREEDDP
jgi:hypothetical protein